MRRIIITATPNYIQEIRILVEICHSYKHLIIYGAVRRYKISGRRPKRTTKAGGIEPINAITNEL